jgi:DnaK suppressor protein
VAKARSTPKASTSKAKPRSTSGKKAATKAPARTTAKRAAPGKAAPKAASRKPAKPAPKKPARKTPRASTRASARPPRNSAPPTPPRGAPQVQQAPTQLKPETANRPRKNQAGLNARDLQHFRDLLLEKRRELVGDMSAMESEALRSSSGTNLSNLPLHMADMGTDNYEQEFTLGLVEKDRQLLREINHALAKIQDGTYGICEGTGKTISKPRLEAQPWAKYSIEHARELEKNRFRGE